MFVVMKSLLFLMNNPSVGTVVLGSRVAEFEQQKTSSKQTTWASR